ncbi:cyclodeaminase [Devosia nitrariae]|uniref:Cyclodeaminase n=1 Tax=Devosia nitrariae TaxID=2071872 RepID=A0ABQ5W967_9HYPH|nr:cyclodeaminase [Devosia nitrariae]GLQ56475.1 cyclodeaminase [Devosia nitrariae]
MPDVTILTERDLRACVALDPGSVDIVEGAFAALAGGGVVMPPILSMAIAEKHGEVDVKTAYVPGLSGFAIKVSPGFFDNPKRGLPSLNGLMIVLDAETGIVKAVLLDNGYLTDVRTAAAGAVAARHLALANVETVGVIGAGVQAELQIEALALVRPFARLLVWSRDTSKANAYADRMTARLGRPVAVAETPEALVRQSQVVVTTTPSRSPLIRAEWMHPGLHITAMGSDSSEKNELDPSIVTAADRFVCDRLAQSRVVGELRSAIAADLVGPDHMADELGAICAGHVPGRRSDDEITVCDLTGTGVQDTSIAVHALDVARARGLGQTVES